MAAFNFPNSPSTNDVHTENGVSWKWNGTVWKKVASPDTIAKADSKVQVVDAGTGGYITAETDGTQRLRVQNSGAIVTGILTATSFVGPLTGNVTGNASGSSGSCTGNAAGLTGTPNITVGSVTGTTITGTGDLKVGVSTFFVDQSEGKVGINTAVLDRRLEVFDVSQGTISIKSGDAGQSSLWLADVSDSNIGGIYYEHSNNALGIRVNDAERLRITSAGRVNIVGICSAAGGFVGDGSNLTNISGIPSEADTAVSSTSATTVLSLSASTYRAATVDVVITQGSAYQAGTYGLIHDGTTATIVEQWAIATGDMLGTFTATVSGGNMLMQVNMGSSSSATVTVKSSTITV